MNFVQPKRNPSRFTLIISLKEISVTRHPAHSRIGIFAYAKIRQTALGQTERFSYTKDTMNGQIPFRIFFADCETVICQISRNLETAGLRVFRSFNLRSACGSFPDNVCPHHSTAPCDCQLVVLLIFGAGTPVSLILHSHRGQTELQWEEAPEARPSLAWQAYLQSVIEGTASDVVNQEGVPATV